MILKEVEKLREAKATTLRRVRPARSCAMKGKDVVDVEEEEKEEEDNDYFERWTAYSQPFYPCNRKIEQGMASTANILHLFVIANATRPSCCMSEDMSLAGKGISCVDSHIIVHARDFFLASACPPSVKKELELPIRRKESWSNQGRNTKLAKKSPLLHTLRKSRTSKHEPVVVGYSARASDDL
jgi:hypothetical protein